MRTLLSGMSLAILVLTGCHGPLETKERHIVHRAEAAKIVRATDAKVYIAVARSDCDAMVTAVNQNRRADIDSMRTAGKVAELEAGTTARVLHESFNERQVEITSGPRKGITGWLPFEWLQPM